MLGESGSAGVGGKSVFFGIVGRLPGMPEISQSSIFCNDQSRSTFYNEKSHIFLQLPLVEMQLWSYTSVRIVSSQVTSWSWFWVLLNCTEDTHELAWHGAARAELGPNPAKPKIAAQHNARRNAKKFFLRFRVNQFMSPIRRMIFCRMMQ